MLNREAASFWSIETISQEENEDEIKHNIALRTGGAPYMLDRPIGNVAVHVEESAGQQASAIMPICGLITPASPSD